MGENQAHVCSLRPRPKVPEHNDRVPVARESIIHCDAVYSTRRTAERPTQFAFAMSETRHAGACQPLAQPLLRWIAP